MLCNEVGRQVSRLRHSRHQHVKPDGAEVARMVSRNSAFAKKKKRGRIKNQCEKMANWEASVAKGIALV